eukprot:CAMPEP_0194541730 /NCGR_PEP_ID=MMETSP0253-20130528/82713_1 /TAXON_ID=2966 /ORGANISM="Noctiluca scintillans" /LENGTH=58 /DNA_ID=CAMNT_0039388253 /DNA_START=100 /DNA_END=272 /DNA_ORIENTATION=-
MCERPELFLQDALHRVYGKFAIVQLGARQGTLRHHGTLLPLTELHKHPPVVAPEVEHG